MRRLAALAVLLAACGGALPQPERAGSWQVTPLQSGVTAGLRGLDVVNARVVWASGGQGTVLRSTDGGASWRRLVIPDADSLDFRDVEAFDSMVAYVLSAGEDGRIYHTRDGGRSWTLQFRNQVKGAFWDCFAFWDAQTGIAMSDPVDGRYLFVRTVDGRTWQPVPSERHPGALTGEAAFAASGTCLVANGTANALLATGGADGFARVLMTTDRGASWRAVQTPVRAGTQAAGIFSLAFKDAMTGFAAGGNYTKPDEEFVVAATANGGRSWDRVGTTGYVSGAAVVPGTGMMVVVGTPGTRVSRGGASWLKVDSVEYNAVQFAADGTGYAVGPRGGIAKLTR